MKLTIGSIGLLCATLLMAGCVTTQQTDPLQSLREQATAGDPDSQYKLALSLQGGINTEQDYEEAMTWFSAAAEQGNPDAAFMAGSGYLAARGVPKNPEKAVTYLEIAANSGNARARYLLGQTLLNGDGIPAEPLWGLYWILEAAKQSHPEAMTTLGAAYRGGVFGEEAPGNGLAWLSSAADAGSTLAEEATPVVAEEVAVIPASQRYVYPNLLDQGDWDPRIVFVQAALTALKLDPGPLDGIEGERTITALRQFNPTLSGGAGIRDALSTLREALSDQSSLSTGPSRRISG